MKKPKPKKTKKVKRPVVTVRRMKDDQAECRRLRAKGDAASLTKAQKIESEWKDHPNYESDAAFFLRVQAG
jgi:hypothetical protein